ENTFHQYEEAAYYFSIEIDKNSQLKNAPPNERKIAIYSLKKALECKYNTAIQVEGLMKQFYEVTGQKHTNWCGVRECLDISDNVDHLHQEYLNNTLREFLPKYQEAKAQAALDDRYYNSFLPLSGSYEAAKSGYYHMITCIFDKYPAARKLPL